MRVLVLGANGVIGSAFSHHVEKQGHSVIRWDVTLDPEHDLRVPGSLHFVLKEVDFVAFFAFDVGGSKYPTESTEYISNNMRLLENTFNAIRLSGLPFIHTTSQMSNMDHNPYGPLKRIAEFYTEYLGGINVKVWNVYGPEDIGDKSHVITDFIHQAKTTGEIRMMTDGEEMRQFLHADDFSTAVYYMMTHYDEFKGRMIDVSNYEWVSILSVANTVADIHGAIVVPGTKKANYQTKTNEPSKQFLETGWVPKISLREGILRYE
jgi:nucleoside-diphosphate-sugar epimerase